MEHEAADGPFLLGEAVGAHHNWSGLVGGRSLDDDRDRIARVTATASASRERELKALLCDQAVLPGTTRAYLSDATESRNLRGKADAIALPNNADQVAKTVAWCYAHDVPLIQRGGGNGFTGGAVPRDGGAVLSL